MFYSDYHVHTSFSDDCSENMEDVIQRAVEIGLEEIALTDHVDFDYPDKDWPFLVDYEKYCVEFERLKKKYSSQITVRLGIEIGLQPHVKEQVEKLIESYTFDFVIGSVHCADRLDFCRDDFFEGKSQSESYRRYFENVLENVKQYKGLFDVLGHMDLIARYGGYSSRNLEYEDFPEIMDEILRLLISNGQGIEINTSGFRYGLGRIHPHPSIVERYVQLGGDIITIGSDAHKKEDLCAGFESAYELLEDLGVKNICSFSQRKCIFMDL